MAVPKRKTSKTRKRNRHSHTHVSIATVGLCPQCRAPKAAHHACLSCGYYRGRQFVAVGSGDSGAS